MVERERTGITGLDKILNGGFPKGSTVMVLGAPGTGKTVFCQQFLSKGVREGQGSLFITLDNHPDEILENSKDFGWNLDSRENFLIMDVYSWKLGEEITGKYTIRGPSDLNQLNMTLSDALNDLGKDDKRLAMDSASSLTFYTDINSTVRFLQVVSAKTKYNNGVFVLTVAEGVHDEHGVSTLNYVADGVIRLKKENNKMYLKIPRMAKTSVKEEWHEFKITKTGIEIV